MTSFSIKLVRDVAMVASMGLACMAGLSGSAFAQQRASMQHCVPEAGRLFENYVAAANETPANVGEFFSQIFLAATANDLLNASPKDAASTVEFERTNMLLARGRRVEKKLITCSDTGCRVRTTMIDKQGARHSFVFDYSSPIAECESMLIDRWHIAVPL